MLSLDLNSWAVWESTEAPSSRTMRLSRQGSRVYRFRLWRFRVHEVQGFGDLVGSEFMVQGLGFQVHLLSYRLLLLYLLGSLYSLTPSVHAQHWSSDQVELQKVEYIPSPKMEEYQHLGMIHSRVQRLQESFFLPSKTPL